MLPVAPVAGAVPPTSLVLMGEVDPDVAVPGWPVRSGNVSSDSGSSSPPHPAIASVATIATVVSRRRMFIVVPVPILLA
ncbi:MAG: hypothetical protein WKF58_09325 [Ilumatobacteraceae bacterium]